MKSAFKALIFLFAFSIICSSFSAFADSDTISEDYYGTYEEGMYLKQGHISKVIPLDGIHNWDFAEGFKYWTGLSGKKPINYAQLFKEGNTRYIKLTGQAKGSGIITPPTIVDRLKPGQQACIVYDWKGNAADFQVYLIQWVPGGGGVFTERKLGLMYGKTLHEAKNVNDWNTSATRANGLVLASNSGNENIYISAAMQIVTEKPLEADARIANIKLCVMNVISGRIYDLDGNLIKSDTYEYKEDKTDYGQTLEGFEGYYKNLKDQQTKRVEDAKKKLNQSSNIQTVDENKANKSKTIIIIVCISVVVIAICAFVVTAVMLKKPSKQKSDKELPKGE